MANTRDQQDLTLVLIPNIKNTKIEQEVIFVLGPPMTITTPTTGTKKPQVCVIT